MQHRLLIGWLSALLLAVAPSLAFGVTPQLSGGAGYRVALHSDGGIWSWGFNGYNYLGTGSSAYIDSTPARVLDITDAVAVDSGDGHSLALLADGTLRAWGSNSFGQIGDGNTVNPDSPVAVAGLSDVVAISAGKYHSLAVLTDGTVWAWGGNDFGQLGDGTTSERHTPTQISTLSGVVAVAAGDYHSLALHADGTLSAWGNNGVGQLGDGTTTLRTEPTPIPGLDTVSDIAAGGYFSAALDGSGAVWVWGHGRSGQMGNGTTTSDNPTPGQVPDLSGIAEIHAGSGHLLARDGDGAVWSWGENYNGQIGDGSRDDRTTPYRIPSLSGVIAVGTSAPGSAALTGDGAVWSWGHTGWEDGLPSSTAPVAVSGLNLLTSGEAPTNGNGDYAGPAISDLRATPGDGAITLSWNFSDPGNTLAAIRIRQSTDGYPASPDEGSLVYADTGLTTTLSGLTNGLPYYFTLFAYDGNGNVASPLQVSATPGAAEVTIRGHIYAADASAAAGYRPLEGAQIRVLEDASRVAYSGSDGSYELALGEGERYHLYFTMTGYHSADYRPNGIDGEAITVTAGSGTTLSDTALIATSILPDSDAARCALQVIHYVPVFGQIASAADFLSGIDTLGAHLRAGRHNQAVIQATALLMGEVAPAIGQLAALEESLRGLQGCMVALDQYELAGRVQEVIDHPAVEAVSWIFESVAGSAARSIAVGSFTLTLSDAQGRRTVLSGGTVTLSEIPGAYIYDLGEGRYWAFVFGGDGDYTLSVEREDGGDPVTGTLSLIRESAAGSEQRLEYGELGFDAAGATATLAGVPLSPTVALDRDGDGSAEQTVAAASLPSRESGPRIAAGSQFSLAMNDEGSAWGWGDNSSGNLGDGTTEHRYGPVRAAGLPPIATLTAGAFHTLALTDEGEVWVWGNPTSSPSDLSETPSVVSGLGTATQLSAGAMFSLALDANGNVHGWGRNQLGQLGDGTTESRYTPVQVLNLAEITAISSGWGHSLALAEDGTIWAWGDNDSGQLGNGWGGGTESEPVEVTSSNLGHRIAAVAAGRYHSLALTEEGLVWSWGGNDNGQLGLGHFRQVNVPRPVEGLRGIVAITAGGTFSLALDYRGRVWAFGGNAAGELGDGSGENQAEPVGPLALPPIVAVAAGNQHGMALAADGSVWSWGLNLRGALGTGSADHSAIPVQVVGEAGGHLALGETALEAPSENCTATLFSDFRVEIPALSFADQLFWARLEHHPLPEQPLLFRAADYGPLDDRAPFARCAPSPLSGELALSIPLLQFGDARFWVDLRFEPRAEGLFFAVDDFGTAP